MLCFPSLSAQSFKRAWLWSCSELGFSILIRFILSSLNSTSRANSKWREQDIIMRMVKRNDKLCFLGARHNLSNNLHFEHKGLITVDEVRLTRPAEAQVVGYNGQPLLFSLCFILWVYCKYPPTAMIGQR